MPFVIELRRQRATLRSTVNVIMALVDRDVKIVQVGFNIE
jgi:hypothetical protein